MDNDKPNAKPSEMNPEDLPDVRAFNDEFTRDFLQSTEETRPGYYPFLSGTGAYKMDFPAGGIVGEKGYGIIKEKKEGYLIGIENEDGTGSSITINYYSHPKADDIEIHLEQLEDRLGTDVEFKKMNSDGDKQLLYFTDAGLDGEFYTFAGYVQNEVNNGGIEVIYNTRCIDSEEKCTERKEKEKERVIKWMKSIQFVNKDRK
ncbi:hypothetical protein F3157_21735 [Virgibacillus dakarensis]|uniref:Uncharacterized protein n=1 Tax=Lentibacillus populi TaxID=1827502 RepID=A0A9W5X4J9_9BACI|nr:hypothetical protein [Lentibacillus populi]MBT2218025.1 hypothetical protein [Virgibacillus dakarensis]MTW88218.1 hypothetical protein [Virgibacillus dakarensis]GGB32099.1 hypothetical protein GCM10011409_06860 [Lentibacillus populi]